MLSNEPSCIEVRPGLIDLGDTDEVYAMRARSFWIVIFIQLAALELFAQPDSPLPLEIYVYNPAGVPKSVLSRAERRVTRILALAGVQADWPDCSVREAQGSPCFGLLVQGAVAVQIVHGTKELGDDAFGAAFLGEGGTGSQTDVFYDRIGKFCAQENLHDGWNVSLAELLGNVMAHEIGHLLLGLHAHSPFGIMCPIWTDKELWQAERGMLLFSDQQSNRIRERLRRFTMAKREEPVRRN